MLQYQIWNGNVLSNLIFNINFYNLIVNTFLQFDIQSLMDDCSLKMYLAFCLSLSIFIQMEKKKHPSWLHSTVPCSLSCKIQMQNVIQGDIYNLSDSHQGECIKIFYECVYTMLYECWIHRKCYKDPCSVLQHWTPQNKFEQSCW